MCGFLACVLTAANGGKYFGSFRRPGKMASQSEGNCLKLSFLIKGSLDEKLPIYERDPKSKRLDSFEKRFVRDWIRLRRDS